LPQQIEIGVIRGGNGRAAVRRCRAHFDSGVAQPFDVLEKQIGCGVEIAPAEVQRFEVVANFVAERGDVVDRIERKIPW
jgi:hypothetical protein